MTSNQVPQKGSLGRNEIFPIYFVDAFTTNGNSPFTGNPAAVCFLEHDDDIPDDIKQKIAAEINLSETAFVSLGWTAGDKLVPVATSAGSLIHPRTLRWFTPTNEVPLCGHATLASTKALVEAQLAEIKSDPGNIEIRFESKVKGTLGATVDNASGRITLNFPSHPTEKLDRKEHSAWIDEMIRTTLGKEVSPELVCDVQYSPGLRMLLLRLQNRESISAAEQIKLVSPDCKKLLAIDTGNLVHDIVVTIKGDNDASSQETPHFYSRLFAPWDGIDEDPVTGAAHTILAPYWTNELGKSLAGESPSGNITLFGRQHSARGGNVYCTVVGDRVHLAGEARVTIKGHLV